MKLTVEVTSENAAAADDPVAAALDVIDAVKAEIELCGPRTVACEGVVRDINGNRVGRYRYER